MGNRAVWTNGQYWGSPIRIGAHHYAGLLAESGWEVAFCSDPISPFHFLKWSTLRDTRERLTVWRAGGRRDRGGRVFDYTPFTLLPHYPAPVLRGRWVLDHWHRLTVPGVRRVLAARGFDRPDLLVLDSVIQGCLLDALRPAKTLMRVADDLSGFRGVTPAMLDRERELIGRVDHVVYTARRLEAKIAACRPKAMTYVPNGADVSHFRDTPAGPPPEYDAIPPPRAVYVGAIDDWFDPELVARAAGASPGVSFVVVGPVRTNLSALAGLRNVHVLGRRPYAEVPRYMAAAQVGLIPFRVTEMVRSVHPIKLYEYMACGLPVVSVAWDELEGLASPAVLCRTPDEFAAAVPRAIAAPPPRAELIAYASRADWKNRFALITRALGL